MRYDKAFADWVDQVISCDTDELLVSSSCFFSKLVPAIYDRNLKLVSVLVVLIRFSLVFTIR